MIRYATLDDVDGIIELGILMHAESRYSDKPIDFPFLRSVVSHIIRNQFCVVCVNDEKIIGMLLGGIDCMIFSKDAKYAHDFAFYIKLEYRGRYLASKMIKCFEEWADGLEVRFGSTVAINDERLYKLLKGLGYEKLGEVYYKGAS